MNPRALIIVVIASVALVGSSFAKTAGCPCSPCKCAPCTCGGGGSKSGGGGKHHDKEHGGHHEHGGGVGGTVDLSGVGHRNAEPDPFAAGGSEKPVAHSEEKRTAKHKDHEPKTSTFDDIKLTGVEGKGDIPPPNTFNVDNEQVEPPKFGWGDTKEKPNDKKDTEKKLTDKELDELWDARRLYYKGLFALEDKMTVDLKALRGDLKTLDRQNSPELKKKADEYNKFLKTLEDTFAKSEEGKKAFDAWLKTYEKFYKTGAKIPKGFVPGKSHPFLSPYAGGDDMANKKYALEDAERQLEMEKGNYERMQNDAVSKNDAYRKLESGPDKDKAAKDIANEWASTNEAKEQMKKVQQAEKAYGDAKEAFKPYEKFAEEKKEASK
jgi:hypothetical protein